MAMVDGWTGESAHRLQNALRLSNEGFAERVGVSTRSVASWRARPEMVPLRGVQRLLDRTLTGCDPESRARFEALGPAWTAPALEVQPLRVAICVVVRDGEVLLVCRREDAGGISWQFPAGVVKPGRQSELVAVRETLGETGVRCSVIRSLGSRVHPVTGALCDYLLADFLGGEASNGDEAENADVTWAKIVELGTFIPLERIHKPILDALELT